MEGNILQKYYKNCCCDHWRTENVKWNQKQNCYNNISRAERCHAELANLGSN